MRVIAGTAKRLQLKTPEGLDTRPTTDRIKETLFNMISTELSGCTFLDLFSGSGGIGIEALSRGARLAVFIENNNKALRCLKENLEHTQLYSRAQVIPKDVIFGLKALESKRKELSEEGFVFDVVFLDPPYESGLEKKVLEVLSKSSIINSESTVIVEVSIETTFDELEEIGFSMIKEKKYKSNRHVFLRKSP